MSISLSKQNSSFGHFRNVRSLQASCSLLTQRHLSNEIYISQTFSGMATSIFGMKNFQMQQQCRHIYHLYYFSRIPANYRRQRHFPIAFRVMTALEVYLQSIVLENHRKSLIQHCQRSQLHLHFECPKFIFRSNSVTRQDMRHFE